MNAAGNRRDRVLAGAVSGPLGRGFAFVVDFSAALWRGARPQGDQSHSIRLK